MGALTAGCGIRSEDEVAGEQDKVRNEDEVAGEQDKDCTVREWKDRQDSCVLKVSVGTIKKEKETSAGRCAFVSDCTYDGGAFRLPYGGAGEV